MDNYFKFWEEHRGYASPIAVFGKNPRIVTVSEPLEFEGSAPQGLYGDGKTEPDYRAIAEHYGIEHKGGGERIAVLTNPESIQGPITQGDLELRLQGITSVDIAAAKAGKVAPFYDLALIGAVITRDCNLIVGTRGRRHGVSLTEDRVIKMADNCLALAPGGGVTFRTENPLEYTLKSEAQEELGISPEDIEKTELIGLFNAGKIGPSGYKFVAAIHTRFKASAIIQSHIDSLARYNDLGKQGFSKEKIANVMESEGRPRDVWEHSQLRALSFEPGEIRKFVRHIPASDSNLLEHQKCGIGIGALLMAAEYADFFDDGQ